MALFGKIFKTEEKKTEKKEKIEKKDIIKEKKQNPPAGGKETKTTAIPVSPKPKIKDFEQKKIHPFLDKILVSAQITEKAAALAEKNQYVFKVGETANKSEIKKAVEQTFGVKVEGVKITKVPSKRKRIRGRFRGVKQGYKKAIVKIRQGQTIELLPR
jgi:large subunit ribosomal protein L23